jgi:hypothetical protein
MIVRSIRLPSCELCYELTSTPADDSANVLSSSVNRSPSSPIWGKSGNQTRIVVNCIR